jgi:plasmid maintenance system antidote protein VapI
MSDGRIKPKATAGRSGRVLLERWMVRMRLTQGEAAELIGISRVTLNQYLNGDKRPGLEAAVRIEDATGITGRSWLIDEPPAPMALAVTG